MQIARLDLTCCVQNGPADELADRDADPLGGFPDLLPLARVHARSNAALPLAVL